MPEPPCPMQIFLSGARKEEFSLPVLVFRRIVPFGGYGPKTNVLSLRKRCSVASFFVLFLLQYIYRRQKLNNKYFPKNFFKKFLYNALIFFIKKRPELSLRPFSFCIFSSFLRKSYLRRERTPCGCWLA